jgi:DivIVA domain-containing protein
LKPPPEKAGSGNLRAVELERRDIERSDFASVRRGYDPIEVDQHLRAVADAAERNQEASPNTAAAAASRGVQKILESAEKLAADIEQAAREEGEKIEAAARAEGEQIVARARDRAAAEERRAQGAGERLKRANSELNRLREGLANLQPVGLDEDVDDEPPAPTEEAPAATAHGEPMNGDGVAQVAQESPAEAAHEAAPEEEAAGDGEGARLIALNMAMTGTPREETARYLAANFELEDPEAILDDAYSRPG